MTRSLRHRFSQPGYHVLLYTLAVAAVLLLGALAVLRGIEIGPLEVRDYGLLGCDTSGDAGLPVLRILDAVYVDNAVELLEPWCSAERIAPFFSGVQVRRVHRDQVDLRDLYEERHDLVLAKTELVEAAGESGRQGITYRKIAAYPDYGSQLVSLDGTPELNAAWLSGKRLGMVDDPNSVSGYQIPMAALKKRGLESLPDIVYFRSYSQLYEALFRREVDVIPSLLSNEGPTSALQLPQGLVLEETLPGPGWYISEDLAVTEARCAVQAVLKELSTTARIDYLRALTLVGDCGDE